MKERTSISRGKKVYRRSSGNVGSMRSRLLDRQGLIKVDNAFSFRADTTGRTLDQLRQSFVRRGYSKLPQSSFRNGESDNAFVSSFSSPKKSVFVAEEEDGSYEDVSISSELFSDCDE
jgi:hypothetical protein